MAQSVRRCLNSHYSIGGYPAPVKVRRVSDTLGRLYLAGTLHEGAGFVRTMSSAVVFVGKAELC